MLANRIDRKILKENLHKETFKRRTISFYKYFEIAQPTEFRDTLYQCWSELNCFGRIYIAREGINAQMSVPEHNMQLFLDALYAIPMLDKTPIKYAIEDDGNLFINSLSKCVRKLWPMD